MLNSSPGSPGKLERVGSATNVLRLGGTMRMTIVAIAAWVLTGLILLLGINVGRAFWFYMEPVVDTVPVPASYKIAAVAGILALVLSLFVSVGATLQAARGSASTTIKSS